MGTVLKVLGIVFVGWLLLSVVGCMMIASVVRSAASSPAVTAKRSAAMDELRTTIEEAAERARTEREAQGSSYSSPSYTPSYSSPSVSSARPGQPMLNPNPGAND